jgi:PIN domain nuclease of toxin-antitoxin system
MTLVLDAGALVAIERFDRTVRALLQIAQENAVSVRTSAAVVAQVWRDGARQANLARALAGADTVPLDSATAKRIGLLLRQTGSTDVVDAHVAWLADEGDQVLTSDPLDIGRLLSARGVRAAVVGI